MSKSNGWRFRLQSWWQLDRRERKRQRMLRSLGGTNRVYEADHRCLGTSASYDADCPTCNPHRGRKP